jgi:MoaA/NifB/PqqE/SkfB family radical SAM enzyme
MPLSLFRRLKPVLQKTDLVYLQGWGEPFTHPEFLEFVRFSQAAGCQVGTTTNGLLLTEDLCRQIVDMGLDTIAFSLAGRDQENDRIRKGTSLVQVMAAIATLNRIKQALGVDRPALHIAYLLLRSRLEDLEKLPAFFAALGVDQVVISTLDLIASPVLIDEALVPENESEFDELRGRLDATIATAARLGLPMHAWLAHPARHLQEVRDVSEKKPATLPGNAAICTENINNAAVIAVDGSVSPCVYTQLPLSTSVRHWVDGKERSFKPLAFGNIHQASFTTIWRSEAYTAFRRAHRAGHPPMPCANCIRMRMGA